MIWLFCIWIEQDSLIVYYHDEMTPFSFGKLRRKNRIWQLINVESRLRLLPNRNIASTCISPLVCGGWGVAMTLGVVCVYLSPYVFQPSRESRQGFLYIPKLATHSDVIRGTQAFLPTLLDSPDTTAFMNNWWMANFECLFERKRVNNRKKWWLFRPM